MGKTLKKCKVTKNLQLVYRETIQKFTGLNSYKTLIRIAVYVLDSIGNFSTRSLSKCRQFFGKLLIQLKTGKTRNDVKSEVFIKTINFAVKVFTFYELSWQSISTPYVIIIELHNIEVILKNRNFEVGLLGG